MGNLDYQIMSYIIYFQKLIFEFVWCCIREPDIWLLLIVMMFYLIITLFYLTCVCRFINVITVILSYTFIFLISLKLPYVSNFCNNYLKVSFYFCIISLFMFFFNYMNLSFNLVSLI